MSEQRYKIVRHFADARWDKKNMFYDLTLEEAQEYCKRADTSSATAPQTPGQIKYNEQYGAWFDGYTEQ